MKVSCDPTKSDIRQDCRGGWTPALLQNFLIHKVARSYTIGVSCFAVAAVTILILALLYTAVDSIPEIALLTILMLPITAAALLCGIWPGIAATAIAVGGLLALTNLSSASSPPPMLELQELAGLATAGLFVSFLARLLSRPHRQARPSAAGADHLLRLVTASEDALIGTDKDGLITYWSAGAARLTGYTDHQIHGQPLSRLGKEVSAQATALVSAPGQAEIQCRHRDGTMIDVLLAGSPLHTDTGAYDGLVITLRQLSGDRLPAAKLPASAMPAPPTDQLLLWQNTCHDLERRDLLFRRMADSLPSLISYWDKNQRLQFANTPYLSERGLIRQDAMGKTIAELALPQYLEELKPRIDAVLNGQPQHFERTTVGVSAAPAHYVVDYIPDIHHGDVEGFTVVTTNISAIKATEITLREAHRQLETALRQAQAATVAKNSFISNMSHELRTPLNAILGFAYLLGNSTLSADQRVMLDKMEASGQSLLNLINDILDFTKIDAGQMEAEPSAVDVADILDDVAAIIAPQVEKKGLSLHVSPPPAAFTKIITDPLRLKQVLNNLLNNAVKFTDFGEIDLSVTVASAPRHHPTLRFCVKDTGIGISPAKQAAIFREFAQADTTDTRPYGGTGLGLAISRHIVSLLGGEIGVDSSPGEGSTFWFSLPVTLAHKPQQGQADVTAAGSPPLKVLVAGVIPFTRNVLAAIAGSLGWRVDVVDSVSQATDRLSGCRMGGGYHLVLLDWRPLGGESLAAIRAALERTTIAPRPLLVVVTAQSPEEIALLPESRLADTVLTKPLTPAQLQEALHHLQNGGMPETLIRQPAGNAVQMTRRDARPTDARLKHVRIMICDDNEVNRDVTRRLLENEGAHVILSNDGESAIEWLRFNAGVDIVLMDIQMPKVNGLNATRAIRHDLGLTDLPIVAVSAGVLADQQTAALNAGMNDFLRKPLDIDQAVAVIQQLTGHHPHRQPNQRQPEATQPSASPIQAAATTPPAAPLIDITAFNAQAALERWPDAETLHNYMRRYLPQLNEYKDRLHTLMIAEDWEQLATLTHKLRGTAGDFQLGEVCDAAGTLQIAARAAADHHSNPARISTMVRSLQQKLEHGCAAMTAYLNHLDADTPEKAERSETPEKSARPDNESDPTPALIALLAALDSDSPQIIKPALAEATRRLGSRPMEPIRVVIDDFDFRGAEEKLRALVENLGVPLTPTDRQSS